MTKFDKSHYHSSVILPLSIIILLLSLLYEITITIAYKMNNSSPKIDRYGTPSKQVKIYIFLGGPIAYGCPF